MCSLHVSKIKPLGNRVINIDIPSAGCFYMNETHIACLNLIVGRKNVLSCHVNLKLI